MAAPILATKLYIPPLPPKVVPRPQLVGRLGEGLHCQLTLVSAPAGFGKTTLVSEWLAECGRPVAWLSLDDSHNDPTSFIAYVLAALQTVSPSLGKGALDILKLPEMPGLEPALTVMVNDISALVDPMILVLDDYHAIDAKSVDDALAFFLRNLPPQLHLVLITREDPDLPLALLRARGQMTEVRATDLRFSSTEAADFLNSAIGLNLSTEEVDALEARTEGWITGLQLAAISMQGQADTAGFIRSFTGSHHFVVDYLLEEVLQQQPASIQHFLLCTSILDRFCASLCDAVVGDAANTGQEVLENVRQANLFMIPLDNERQWYRYHHLFSDLLRQRLEASTGKMPQPEELHRRASLWFEARGLELEALEHALTAKDFERAADIAERLRLEYERRFQTATWLEWVRAIPEKMVRNRPVLCYGSASALMEIGEIEAGETYLREAERWADLAADGDTMPKGMVVADRDQWDNLPFELSCARAYIAQVSGDVDTTVAYARQALELANEDEYLKRGAVKALLGLSQWVAGDLETAHQTFIDVMHDFQRSGHRHFAAGITVAIGRIEHIQGCLGKAITSYEQAIAIADKEGAVGIPVSANMYSMLSQIHCERGDFETADQCLRQSRELGEQAAFPIQQHLWDLARARLLEAQGALDRALEALDDAQRHYCRTAVPYLRPAAALKVRIWIAMDRMAEVRAWLKDQTVRIDSELTYMSEFTHLTMARAIIAEYRHDPTIHALDSAMSLLDRLASAAEDGRRNWSLIEILVITALAHEATGDLSRALEALSRAMTLAAPEGYARIFADEGEPMARLLAKAAREKIHPDYAASLRIMMDAGTIKAAKTPAPSDAQPLVEPLSRRELEILNLIAQGFSNNDIAERLFLALTTIKGHNQNIFGKLGVKRRTEAVARARELGIL